MQELIVSEVGRVDYSELGAYGINSRFINDDFATKEMPQYFKITKKQWYAPKQTIFQENTCADTVYIILEGIVKILSYLPNGKARIIRLHGPGSVLGLTGIFEDVHKHKAVAVRDVVLLKIASGSFKLLKRENPQQFLGITEKIYENLNIAEAWITQFCTGSIKARVARLITFLSYLETDTTPDFVELLTCEEMASVLGVTTESVSRTLADFKRRKILQRVAGHGDLYRRNAQLLKELSQDVRSYAEVLNRGKVA